MKLNLSRHVMKRPTGIRLSKGKEPGNPAKNGAALQRAIESENPPLRFPLGVDSHFMISAHLQRQTAELEQWSEVTKSTDFNPEATAKFLHATSF